MTPVPVTLGSAAALGLLNMWLGWRVGKFRGKFKVSVGDGGHEPLLRRMRAQANFIESAPLFLLLVLGLEISGASRIGLAIIAAIIVFARVAHPFGMESGDQHRWRMVGTMGTGLMTIVLIGWAVICAFGMCLGR
jgi:uncharacterized membrane protein YecN with MAPEG domain